MDAVTDPTIREVWFKKSSQVGYTSMLENIIGYYVDQDPSPMLLVQPTLEIGEAFSKDRLAPMVRDTPVLRAKIADAKSRDSGNTLLHKSFTGGHLTIAGANSASSLASRPIRVLLLDEIDRYPRSAGTEGNSINLARKRTTAFWHRRIIGGSTPTVKGASQIDDRFENSDQRYLYVACAHCEFEQKLIWAQVKWTDDNPRTARYACENCGVLWSDGERHAAVQTAGRNNNWIAAKTFNGIAGFHINEIYSPFVKLEEMVTNFLEAKKLPETLQTFVNTSLAEVWEEVGTTIESGSLLERREQYGLDNIPEGVLMLTVGVDTQDDRIEVQIDGWGTDEENWIIAQEVFRGDPGKRALWDEVDEFLKRKFNTEDGRSLFVEAACVDSGGHHAGDVYKFVVGRKARRVWAIKGIGGPGRLIWPKKATRTAKSRANVFLIGVDTIKGVLYGRLTKVLEPGAGYIHLPAAVDDEFCKQLTSEKCTTKYVRGRPVLVWTPREKGIRQEAQDCWNYAYAAFVGRRGPDLIKRLTSRGAVPRRPRKVIEDQQQAIEQSIAKPKTELRATPTPPSRPTSGWMGGRRGWMKR